MNEESDHATDYWADEGESITHTRLGYNCSPTLMVLGCIALDEDEPQ